MAFRSFNEDGSRLIRQINAPSAAETETSEMTLLKGTDCRNCDGAAIVSHPGGTYT